MTSEDTGNFTSDANIACYCLNILEASTKVFGLAIKCSQHALLLGLSFIRLKLENAMSSGCTCNE